MHTRLALSSLSLSLAAAFGAGQAWALGFARSQPSVAMGAPLDFVVGIRLDDGELLTSQCVSAEVWNGDNPMARSAVNASLETIGGSPAIRVRTSNRVDEPVVTVLITAGCEGKVSRRFTIFADPPGLTMALPAVVAPEAVAMTAAPERPAMAAVESTVAQPASIARMAVAPVTRSPRADRVARPMAVRPPASASQPVAVAAGMAPPAPARPASAAAGDGSGARLRLDAPSITFAVDRAWAEATERRAAELRALRAAIQGAHSAASSASSRVSSVEASIEALKKEARVNRETMNRLQQALEDADARGRWTPWLLAAVLLLLGAAGWLYARLRRVESDKQHAWWTSSHAALTPSTGAASGTGAPVPANLDAGAASAVETPPQAAPVDAGRPPQVSSPSFFAESVPPTHATQPMPAGLLVPDSPARDVSIEELLDVEQQAEFFIVLGQDEAAIDLMMSHLRSTGGASPLPYLKLLEIYHRRGDQASYDRMRRRFNERFNAVAPDWATGLQAGLSLMDYPEVVARIERDWRRPVDAMATLESLLFRTTGAEMFDLPAYRDLLFLFTLARDLQEMEQHDAPQVDVLLPLGNQHHPQRSPDHDAESPTAIAMEDPPTAVPPEPSRPVPLPERSSAFGSLDLDPRKPT
jgi:pilus assembly protein FimV